MATFILKSSGREYTGKIYPAMTQKEIDFNKENGKIFRTKADLRLAYGRIIKNGKAWGAMRSFYEDEIIVTNE